VPANLEPPPYRSKRSKRIRSEEQKQTDGVVQALVDLNNMYARERNPAPGYLRQLFYDRQDFSCTKQENRGYNKVQRLKRERAT
jgi:hypothetical protein